MEFYSVLDDQRALGTYKGMFENRRVDLFYVCHCCIEVIIKMWLAHDFGLHATKDFVLQPIKQKVNPSFLKHAWVLSQCSLIS